MKSRHVYRKTDRTPEELAELRAARERFSRERPGPEELLASGEYDGPYRHGDVMALLSALAAMKPELAATLIVKHFDPDQVATLVRLLGEAVTPSPSPPG